MYGRYSLNWGGTWNLIAIQGGNNGERKVRKKKKKPMYSNP